MNYELCINFTIFALLKQNINLILIKNGIQQHT